MTDKANQGNILVIGGRTTGFNNTLRESVYELDKVPQQIEEVYLGKVQRASSLGELAAILDDLHEFNYNLVGSRGYCYSSERIAGVIRRGDLWDAPLITRTGGLREKFVELWRKENSREEHL
jgi:hypothetical protein